MSSIGIIEGNVTSIDKTTTTLNINITSNIASVDLSHLTENVLIGRLIEFINIDEGYSALRKLVSMSITTIIIENSLTQQMFPELSSERILNNIINDPTPPSTLRFRIPYEITDSDLSTRSGLNSTSDTDKNTTDITSLNLTTPTTTNLGGFLSFHTNRAITVDPRNVQISNRASFILGTIDYIQNRDAIPSSSPTLLLNHNGFDGNQFGAGTSDGSNVGQFHSYGSRIVCRGTVFLRLYQSATESSPANPFNFSRVLDTTIYGNFGARVFGSRSFWDILCYNNSSNIGPINPGRGVFYRVGVINCRQAGYWWYRVSSIGRIILKEARNTPRIIRINAANRNPTNIIEIEDLTGAVGDEANNNMYLIEVSSFNFSVSASNGRIHIINKIAPSFQDIQNQIKTNTIYFGVGNNITSSTSSGLLSGNFQNNEGRLYDPVPQNYFLTVVRISVVIRGGLNNINTIGVELFPFYMVFRTWEDRIIRQIDNLKTPFRPILFFSPDEATQNVDRDTINDLTEASTALEIYLIIKDFMLNNDNIWSTKNIEINHNDNSCSINYFDFKETGGTVDVILDSTLSDLISYDATNVVISIKAAATITGNLEVDGNVTLIGTSFIGKLRDSLLNESIQFVIPSANDKIKIYATIELANADDGAGEATDVTGTNFITTLTGSQNLFFRYLIDDDERYYYRYFKSENSTFTFIRHGDFLRVENPNTIYVNTDNAVLGEIQVLINRLPNLINTHTTDSALSTNTYINSHIDSQLGVVNNNINSRLDTVESKINDNTEITYEDIGDGTLTDFTTFNTTHPPDFTLDAGIYMPNDNSVSDFTFNLYLTTGIMLVKTSVLELSVNIATSYVTDLIIHLHTTNNKIYRFYENNLNGTTNLLTKIRPRKKMLINRIGIEFKSISTTVPNLSNFAIRTGVFNPESSFKSILNLVNEVRNIVRRIL